MESKYSLFILAVAVLAGFAIFGCTSPVVPPQPTNNYTIAAQGILNIGQSLSFGDGVVRLDDIGVTQNNKNPAIVSILDANGTVLAQKTINPYSSYDQSFSNGAIYRIYVGETALGATLNAKWAQVIVYIVRNSTIAVPSVQQVSIDLAGKVASGNPSGNVNMVEYSDFQCPYCGRVEPTLTQIKTDYQNVAVYFKQFPLPPSMHPYAQQAAEASLCADAQGKFWPYHGLLYANQQALDMNSLKGYANQTGLDMAAFNTCLDSHSMAAKIQADQAEGSALGVQGTPSFVIYSAATDSAALQKLQTAVNSLNQQYSGLGAQIVQVNGSGYGVFFAGALPYEAFKTVLDSF